MLFHVDARIPDGADIAPLLDAEIAAVAELRRAGFITHLWRRPDGTGAYLVVEAEGQESAQAALDALPFPTNGLMVMHVTPIEAL